MTTTPPDSEHAAPDAVLALKLLFDELCIHLASKDLLTQHDYEGLFASSILKLEQGGGANADGAIRFLKAGAPPNSAPGNADEGAAVQPSAS